MVGSGLDGGYRESHPFLSSSFYKQEVTGFASPHILALMYHRGPKNKDSTHHRPKPLTPE